MRITGGEFGGRILHAPKDRNIRPTSDKVRQAIFNILSSHDLIDGAVVIDAFCGTGALGIEALSRGASFCTFMDNSRDSLELCQKNLSQLQGIEKQFQAIKANALKPSLRSQSIPEASLVFLDPPYNKRMIAPALAALRAAGWMANEYAVVMEMDKGESLPETGGQIIADKFYGDTRVIIQLF
jgi:16S rRNA (guanine966-N2)-methyltransferase